MINKTLHPEWALACKRKGTELRLLNGKYYLYEVTSKWNPEKKRSVKITGKLCKKYPKLEGCCLMYRPEDITKVLKSFSIEDIWGIGYRYSKMLKNNNIHTAEQFRQLSPDWVRAKMSVVGLRTWKELHGEACITFGYTVPDKQSICVSRSFAKELTTIEPLTEALATFVSMAAEKLRRQNSLTRQMQIFIYTNKHRKDKAQH